MEDDQEPSRIKYFIIGGVFVTMVIWIIGVKVFGSSASPLPTVSPIQFATTLQQPIRLPIEAQPAPQPIPQPLPKPAPALASTHQPAQKSPEQQMREKMRLLAHYAKPVVVEQTHSEQQNGQQMAGNGRQRGAVAAPERGPGTVWTRNFYERGSNGSGAVQQPPSPYMIMRGQRIPARLNEPINSDAPGQVTATVLQDVRDFATGQYVLIPKGATLVGAYSQRVWYGQERENVAWDQLNFPDGTFMSLAAMPGADSDGTAGLKAETNNHVWATAMRSLLLTVTGAGSSLALRNGYGSGGNYTPTDALTRESGQQIGQQSRQVIERGGQRPPTVTVQPGQVFFVEVTSNLIFSHPWGEEDDDETVGERSSN